MSTSNVYRYPRYYAIGYRWNTNVECDFLEACLKSYGPAGGQRLLDIGCGAGRHLLALAQRGYSVSGIDVQPEMIAYVKEQASQRGVTVQATVDDLHGLTTVRGPFDLAFCFMDTFRFLLTNEEILAHLRAVAERLVPGGLYVVDFWIPRQWDQAGNEIHQWEQTEGDTTVRVFYVQHPESIDPIAQTFDDELVFEVHEAGRVTELRGGPTRTRMILPQEFRLQVERSGVFELLSLHGEFDLSVSLGGHSLSWRMISVLRRLHA